MNHLSILSVVMHVALIHTSYKIAQKAQIFDKNNQITPFCWSALIAVLITWLSSFGGRLAWVQAPR